MQFFTDTQTIYFFVKERPLKKNITRIVAMMKNKYAEQSA